ncbi:MAG: acylphosphatase, partial [Bacteroidales bacterium]|nr:acylphosphatase [Bacteroidales bacterium]
MSKKGRKITVKGLVQGVGFRPFIYRIAHRFNLLGWVENRNDGVIIKVEGEEKELEDFTLAIRKEAPVASNIHSIESTEIPVEN